MPRILSLVCALGAATAGAAFAQAPGDPAPIAPPTGPTPVTAPAPIDPPLVDPVSGTRPTGQALPPAPAVDPTAAVTYDPAAEPTTARMNEFQGDDIGLVLRALAKQARMNVVVSEKVVGTVTMRLEDKTPREAIEVIVAAKGLVMDQTNGVYFIKTAEERKAEPTESGSYTLSYATAEKVVPLLQSQLQSGLAPQFDARTNTLFYREARSNMDKIALFLETVDQPTQQVMIEARLVEVTANPRQSYGINWGGVVGGSTNPQTVRFGGTTTGTSSVNLQTNPVTGGVTPVVVPGELPAIVTNSQGQFAPQELLFNANNAIRGTLSAIGGQFSILSAPAMSITLRMLNEDGDAEFLANPRVVTANNQKAEIKITRAQPVPQLNFNEQTAQAVFSGFQDKEFGNTLNVTPVINKDGFVTLNVKPEISNKVGDAEFVFAGSRVVSPVIDTRTLESNVLIKSGDTLAIGGLLQDEVIKTRSKVPVLGDIPFIGYAFQERVNSRTKRNLLVFITPTIIKQGYGTGLESQVSGLTHVGEEYADPNGWRNNARGAARLVPTSNRQVAADYPKPGVAPAPKRATVRSSSRSGK